MDTQHTPGPWTFELPKEHKHVAKLSGSGWTKFAKVYVRLDGDSQLNHEGLANLNLIATAPELLQLVSRMKQAIELMRLGCRNEIEEYSVLATAEILIQQATKSTV